MYWGQVTVLCSVVLRSLHIADFKAVLGFEPSLSENIIYNCGNYFFSIARHIPQLIYREAHTYTSIYPIRDILCLMLFTFFDQRQVHCDPVLDMEDIRMV